MKLLFVMMVCESDNDFADIAFEQIVTLLKSEDLHCLVVDDASDSKVGRRLKEKFAPIVPGKFDLVERPSNYGYHRFLENFYSVLKNVVDSGEKYDYVFRFDPDAHICNRKFRDLFFHPNLPKLGVISPWIRARRRDRVQFYADLLPIGFRRRVRGGKIEHKWEWAGFRKVWWRRAGIKAVKNGYAGEVPHGSFYLIAWETLQAIAQAGYLHQDHKNLGLVFGDDVIFGVLTKAVGHPIVSVLDVMPDFRCELYSEEGISEEDIRDRGLVYIHPMKSSSWCQTLRSKFNITN